MKTTNDEFSSNSLRWVPRQLAKVLAAAAVLLAAGLPIALASEAGATTAPTVSTLFFSTTLGGSNNGLPGVGAGASIYVGITGTGFAYDGANNVSLSTTAPGVTFLQTKELSTTTAEAAIVTSGTTPAGTYPVTLTDSNGSGTSATSILTIDPAPTATGLDSTSATSVPSNNPTAVSVKVDGTGFDCLSYNQGGTGSATCTSAAAPYAAYVPSVTVTNVSTGVSLETGYIAVGGTTSAFNGTSLTFNVYGKNVNTGNAAAPSGTYSINVLNPDQGAVSLVGVFTVTASGIVNVSPSQVPGTTATTSLTISGAGFEPGATVTSATMNAGTFANTVVVSPSSITTSYTGTANVASLTVTVTNPAAPTGNGAVISLANALGQGEPSSVAPTITSVTLSPTTPIVVGSTGTTPVTITITGTGFGSGSTVEAIRSTGAVASSVTFSPTVNAGGTSLTASVTVSSGATAGVDSVAVGNNGAYSSASPNALTVAGPVITSASPSSLAAGAPVGTVITFTGTGFNSTATATLANFTGVFAVTSPTTATFALTAVAPGAGSNALVVTETVAASTTVVSTGFNYTTNAAPAITTGLLNANTNAIYVGAGAVSVPVTITGTGFASGATVGSFKNAYSVADPGVTATVTKVTSTVISATVTIAANDANVSDGFTVTNVDGGTATVTGFTSGALYIAAAPSITAVTPATAAASSTDTFTITGTNFATGAVVTTSPANGTCGVTTFVSATTLTVTCSFNAAGTSAVSLLVTNLNGGSVTSSPIVPAATPAAAPTPYTSGASGTAKVGGTQTIVVSGGGFYGQPKATSTGAGIKAVVSGDTGTVLTVRVTVTKNTPGWHTLTFTLANGSVFKANYLIKN
jgi:hypothetical protein